MAGRGKMRIQVNGCAGDDVQGGTTQGGQEKGTAQKCEPICVYIYI